MCTLNIFTKCKLSVIMVTVDTVCSYGMWLEVIYRRSFVVILRPSTHLTFIPRNSFWPQAVTTGFSALIYFMFWKFLGGIKVWGQKKFGICNCWIAVLTSFLPHKKFTWADFWGYKYRYTPRRYAPVVFHCISAEAISIFYLLIIYLLPAYSYLFNFFE